MSSVDRESSRERDLVLKHQHSFSDVGRMHIPMWDSSDPERAPPPLPLNPNPNAPITRPNTSATIAAAARAFDEKARESAPASSYTINPMPQKSPERSLIKGAHHRRLQSLQSPSVKELRSFIDGGARTPERSPERSPERTTDRIGSRSGTPLSRDNDSDYITSPVDKSPSRTETPTPATRDFAREAPSLRPSSRPPTRSILGENTPPPSATMLALQNMQIRDFEPPLSNVTNSATPRKIQGQGIDELSFQIQSLTNIATKLKDDMEQLSRRSKDNAIDLMSLKDAATARDEDIRKSLKDLVNNMNSSTSFLGMSSSLSRSGSATSNNLANNKDPNTTPQTFPKSFTLPRIPSPSAFFPDDLVGSPNPYSVEGAASVAMLEKIIREMVTKEGQERLLKELSKLLEATREDTGETAKKVTELADFIKSGSQSQALIRHHTNGPIPAVNLDRNGSIASANFQMPHLAHVQNSHLSKPYASPKAADFVSDEMLKLLKKIKDSVSESGGMTSEVKALVRDLRSEVLGMGRELGRRFDDVEIDGQRSGPEGKGDIGEIVREGLEDLKDHMSRVIRENRRQSSSTVMSKSTVNNQEVYDVVKHALAERGLDQAAVQAQHQGLDKESILEAIKEAYEAYKPNIELEQFGLERNEILECLREGLEDYRKSAPTPESTGISRTELMETIQDAVAHFNPPRPATEAEEVRQDMLAAFRDCLDEVRPTLAQRGNEGPRELEINRDDLFDAVKAGLDGSRTPFGSGVGEEVLNRLHGILTDMRTEFKSYSSANGRDTEQVLDALKDGLEVLRTEIESYVDKAQDVTGKDEIIDTVRNGFESLRHEFEQSVIAGSRDDQSMSKADMLNYIKSEFEHLHETIGPHGGSNLDKDELVTTLKTSLSEMNIGGAVRGLEDEDSQDVKAFLKEELDRLQDTIAQTHSSHKDEILETLREGSNSLVARSEPQSTDELLAFMKEEFDHLRETLATTMLKPGGATDRDDIIDAVRETVDGLRSVIEGRSENASGDKLSEVHDEIKALRDSMGSSMVLGGAISDKDEILQALRTGLDSITIPSGLNDEAVDGLRADLENLRHMITQGITLRSSGADTEEVLDAVRLGLDDLRSHLEKKMDNPERQMSATSEILDALNDGLDSLRSDVTKFVDKPVDMTVSYEILETLKDGLARLREDMNQLKGGVPSTGETAIMSNEVVLAEDPDATLSREVPDMPAPATDISHRQDFEKIEVALAQLHIKVEAMDANIQNPIPSAAPEPPADAAMKEDLSVIELMLKELQDTVAVIAARDRDDKEDTEAIETLLRNTKAKVDDLNFPDVSLLASKEQMDTIEAGLKVVNDAVDVLVAKADESAAVKGDIAVVEVLAGDIKMSLEEFKESFTAKEAELMTKTDLDILGVLCTEMKNKIDELKIPDADTLPEKADMEQLRGLIHDFRDSHDKMRESYETDISVTAKAFDDRKREAEEMVEQITNVKFAIEEFKEDLHKKLETGLGVEGIKDNVKSLEDTIAGNFSITADVKELVETVTREFERLQGAADGLKVDQDEKLATTIQKHHEVRDAVVEEVSKKIDERFDVIMAKYDDAQLLAESSVKVMQEKATHQEELLAGTKTMTDELMLTIDTLGTALTSFQSTFSEVTEKVSQDSQTVFGKVEQTYSKLDDNHTDTKAEHQQTRDQLSTAMTAINDLQNDVTEFHPKFMVTLKEVLALVNQHYEQSQKAQESAQDQLREAAEAARAMNEETRNTFISLPALLPPPPPEPTPVEQYNDAAVQEKLDKLLHSTSETEKSAAQLDRLDSIHAQVMATAAEVTAFVSSQSRLITEDHENKEKEAEEVALLLERRLAQKEQLESDIHDLGDEKESLRAAVAALKAERDALASEKTRLNADVAAFQTALSIRREELHSMDAKADALERRILEGIMDHSRAMLFAKSAKTPAKAQKPQRAVSTASQSTLSSLPPPSAAANGLSMALNSKRPQIRRNNPQQAARRILSLSQITNNVPTGAQAYNNAPVQSGFNNVKRSHSVKTHYGRRQSWGNKRAVSDAHDKENNVLQEENEGEVQNLSLVPHGTDFAENHDLALASPSEREEDDWRSDAGTERRHSYGTAGDESDRRLSYEPADSEHTYGSSYMTSSEAGTYRSTSYGSTMRSTLGAGTVIDEDIEEEDGEGSFRSASEAGDDHEEKSASRPVSPAAIERPSTPTSVGEAQDTLGALPAPGKPHPDSVSGSPRSRRFIYDTDSGLGTELPTANGSGSEADYFRRAAEEESLVSAK